MKRVKRVWLPVLLGVILIATIVGVASARPNARPQEQAWRVLTVHSTACMPQEDDDNWWHGTQFSGCNSGTCMFFCAVEFPAAGEQAVGAVNVKRVTMYAEDDESGGSAEFTLWRVYPPTKGVQIMASASTVDSAADPQVVMDTSIEYNPVYRSQAPVMSVTIGAPNINLYGLYVHYTW